MWIHKILSLPWDMCVCTHTHNGTKHIKCAGVLLPQVHRTETHPTGAIR